MPKTQTLTGGTSQLAPLIKITQRRVNQLVEQGVLTKRAEGDFDLPDAIEAYYTFKYADKDELDYIEEKAKHELAKRQLTEMEVKRRRHELHDAADVEMALTSMLTNFRNQLLALPSKMAGLLVGRSREEIDERLAAEINSRLAELSDYSPTMFDGEATDDEEEDG